MQGIADRSSVTSHRLMSIALMLLAVLLMSGCSTLRNMIGGSAPEPTATDEPRALIATFTPTPILTNTPVPPPTNTLAPVAVAPAEDQAPADDDASADSGADAVEEEAAPTEEPTPTEAPAVEPILSITSPSNVRSGPGTGYSIVGAANPGDQFNIIGKSPDNAWWQICCVGTQEGWVFGQLAQAQNAESVQVAQNIPQPPPATNTPVPPPPTAAPAPTQPPAPAPAADPCVGIGGDGCKWKLREGPSFGASGNELKIQLGFFHGGRGDEAQGSYFIVLTKDGQNVGVPDSVRSRVKDKQSGSLGPYNYEFKTGTGSLPGNTVAGNYEMWVLDGNGERDSRNIQFSVPDGQGLVWMILDQN